MIQLWQNIKVPLIINIGLNCLLHVSNPWDIIHRLLVFLWPQIWRWTPPFILNYDSQPSRSLYFTYFFFCGIALCGHLIGNHKLYIFRWPGLKNKQGRDWSPPQLCFLYPKISFDKVKDSKLAPFKEFVYRSECKSGKWDTCDIVFVQHIQYFSWRWNAFACFRNDDVKVTFLSTQGQLCYNVCVQMTDVVVTYHSWLNQGSFTPKYLRMFYLK